MHSGCDLYYFLFSILYNKKLCMMTEGMIQSCIDKHTDSDCFFLFFVLLKVKSLELMMIIIFFNQAIIVFRDRSKQKDSIY